MGELLQGPELFRGRQRQKIDAHCRAQLFGSWPYSWGVLDLSLLLFDFWRSRRDLRQAICCLSDITTSERVR